MGNGEHLGEGEDQILLWGTVLLGAGWRQGRGRVCVCVVVGAGVCRQRSLGLDTANSLVARLGDS